jgi:Spy/CpxP family protein refolding chaperone
LDQGSRLEHIQHVVARALDGVGATAEQEGKIHDIIAKTMSDLPPIPAERQAMREKLMEILRAPNIDRAAVERLRADQVAAFDERSKKIVGAVLDSADQLTANQRGKLADGLESMMDQHQRMDDRWGDPSRGRMDGGHGQGPVDGRHGPDEDGPNTGPDGR